MKKEYVLSTRVDVILYNKLKEMADEKDMSISKLMYRLLQESVKNK